MCWYDLTMLLLDLPPLLYTSSRSNRPQSPPTPTRCHPRACPLEQRRLRWRATPCLCRRRCRRRLRRWRVGRPVVAVDRARRRRLTLSLLRHHLLPEIAAAQHPQCPVHFKAIRRDVAQRVVPHATETEARLVCRVRRRRQRSSRQIGGEGGRIAWGRGGEASLLK